MKNPDLEERLLADLRQFAVPRHVCWDPLGLMGVRAAVQDRLRDLGPTEEHHFQEGIEAGVNLILRLPGQRPELAPLLVGAHDDGPLHSPGADDNASGLTALLELARELRESRQPLKLMVSLKMLAFTSAEQSYPQEAMRLLYGDRGDFIALVANIGAALMLPGLARAMGRHVNTQVLPVPRAGHDIPDVRLSDHSPFLRNPHDHQSSDTVDTLDLAFFSSVVEGLDEALAAL